MQATFKSSRLLRPVRPWFIYASLLASLVLNFLPTAHWPGMPDWVAFTLCFWSIREFRRVGMGWGFVLGLFMDVADGAILGQHSLAYVVLAYFAANISRRVLWFPLVQQALHVLPLLFLSQLLQLIVRLLTGVEFPGFSYFIGPFILALIWTPMTYLLLLPQYRPAEDDPNRPI